MDTERSLSREMAVAFRLSIGTFLFGVGVGVVLAALVDGTAVDTLPVVGFTDAPRPAFKPILATNAAAVGAVAVGSFLFGTTTFVGLVLNGILIGILLNPFTAGFGRRLVLVAPHGLVEVLAFLFAGVAGYLLPVRVYRFARNRRDRPFRMADIKRWLLLVVVAQACVILGAFIETQVTPQLL